MAVAANRRQILNAALGIGAGFALGNATHVAAQDQPTPTEGPDVGQAQMPAWTFTVRVLEDPYPGKLTFPDHIPDDMRAIRSEVIITNSSDQALAFKNSDVHALDSEGLEYSAGSAGGDEPKLVSQTLPDGERTRGSVWFVMPKSAQLTEIKFYAPSPQLRVRLSK